ncbi:hypothetical protein GQ53DRAFT_633102 [Thozetella sp. PMI_491]|nr:hypothetical protein GQ53DRAFT_633102 [Thozetella sp. PMI_491]
MLACYAEAGPYTEYTSSGFIPFLAAGTAGVDWSTNVAVEITINSVGSIARTFQPIIDTGTCGFMFTALDLPDWNPETEAVPLNAGWEYLSSSHVLYTGYWVWRDVYFNPCDRQQVIKTSIPVLAVTKKVTCSSYSVAVGTDHCPTTPEYIEHNPHVRWMGVGFGREEDGQPQGTPDKNAFINVVSIAGQNMNSYLQGYKINKMGITLGLTDINTSNMFFQDLPARNPVNWSLRTPTIPRDYRSLPSDCISFDNQETCYPGETLLDTGIGKAFMRVPMGVVMPRDPFTKNLNPEVRVAVDLGSPALFTERFTTGTPVAVEPDSVEAFKSARGSFFNTGRHVYRAWNTAYDSVNGRYGMAAI